MLDNFLPTLPKGRGSGRLFSLCKKKQETRAAFALWGLWQSLQNPRFALPFHNPIDLAQRLDASHNFVSRKTLSPLLINGDDNTLLWMFPDNSAVPGFHNKGTAFFLPDILNVYETTPKIDDKWYSLSLKSRERPTLHLLPFGQEMTGRTYTQKTIWESNNSHALTLLRKNIGLLKPLFETIPIYKEANGCEGENWPDFLPWRKVTQTETEKLIKTILPSLGLWVAIQLNGTAVKIKTPNFPSTADHITFIVNTTTPPTAGKSVVLTLSDILKANPLPDKVKTLATRLQDTLQGYTYQAVRQDQFPKGPSRLYDVDHTLNVTLSAHEKMRLNAAFGGSGGLDRT